MGAPRDITATHLNPCRWRETPRLRRRLPCPHHDAAEVYRHFGMDTTPTPTRGSATSEISRVPRTKTATRDVHADRRDDKKEDGMSTTEEEAAPALSAFAYAVIDEEDGEDLGHAHLFV